MIETQLIYYLCAKTKERKVITLPIVGLEDEFTQNKPEATEEIIEQREKEIHEVQNGLEREEITLPKRKLASLREIYSEVVVHDYGDGYHKSADELKEENAFYNLYRKIQGKKTKYRKIDEYIDACRDCLDFLYAVADRQQIYSREEFIVKWSKGKIRINGMYLPKYIGKDRKRLSKKAVAEFVLDGEDSSKFLEELEVPVIDSLEMLDQQRAQLFTKEDYREIFRYDDEYYTLHEKDTFLDEDDPESYNGIPFAANISKKEYRTLMKENPGLLSVFKDTLRGNRLGQSYQEQMIYDMNTDDMEKIAKYDKLYGVKSATDIPVFKGSLLNDSDYQEYMEALDEWEWKNSRVRENGRWYSLEEQNEIRLKTSLERAGWNIRELFGNASKQEKKIKKMIEKEREKEEKLRRSLAKIKKRRKDIRSGKKTELELYEEAFKKSKKDKKKKKQKTKNPQGKPKKSNKKVIESAVKNKKKTVDEILLSSANSTKSFAEYEKEALDWSWGNISGGE